MFKSSLGLGTKLGAGFNSTQADFNVQHLQYMHNLISLHKMYYFLALFEFLKEEAKRGEEKASKRDPRG